MLKLEHRTTDVTVIAPQMETLTATNAASFRQSLMDMIEGGDSRIVIDLGKVTAVDSTGIGALVAVMKRIGMRGDLALCGLCDRVARNFSVTRMDRIFPIHATSSDALRAMAA
jgi:anti-sigma B factor antagonist